MPVPILRAAVKAGWGQGWLNPTGGSPPPPTFVPIASPPLLWGQTTSSQFGILCPIPASPGSSGEGSISLSFPLSSRISVYVCVCVGGGGGSGSAHPPQCTKAASAKRLKALSGRRDAGPPASGSPRAAPPWGRGRRGSGGGCRGGEREGREEEEEEEGRG